MKSIFIASSRKFQTEVNALIKKLIQSQIKVFTAGKWNKSQKDTPQSEKKALITAFKTIDNSDILYIYAKKGYIGKTVAMEIAYAYSKNKTIISSEKIDELSAQALVHKIISHDELMKYCKN